MAGSRKPNFREITWRFLWLALAHRTAKRWTEAVELYRELVDLHPGFAARGRALIASLAKKVFG